jgi:hypothetical protein
MVSASTAPDSSLVIIQDPDRFLRKMNFRRRFGHAKHLLAEVDSCGLVHLIQYPIVP